SRLPWVSAQPSACSLGDGFWKFELGVSLSCYLGALQLDCRHDGRLQTYDCCFSPPSRTLPCVPSTASGVPCSQCDCRQHEQSCTEQAPAVWPRSGAGSGRSNERR